MCVQQHSAFFPRIRSVVKLTLTKRLSSLEKGQQVVTIVVVVVVIGTNFKEEPRRAIFTSICFANL